MTVGLLLSAAYFGVGFVLALRGALRGMPRGRGVAYRLGIYITVLVLWFPLMFVKRGGSQWRSGE